MTAACQQIASTPMAAMNAVVRQGMKETDTLAQVCMKIYPTYMF